MSEPNLEDPDRRAAMARIVGMAAAPAALSMVSPSAGSKGVKLVSSAVAGANVGVLEGQGNVIQVSGAGAQTIPIAEWFTGDINDTSGPFKIAASSTAFPRAPGTAARYEAKTYNFATGSFRRLTFKKGQPIQHLITFETEIYVLAGSATLSPIPGNPAPPITINAGDALFLPSGYLHAGSASEDFVILLAYVSRTKQDAKKALITQRQAVVTTARQGAHRLSQRTYAGDGNAIRIITMSGGRGTLATRTGADVLVYVAKGKVRRKEGDQILELAAGDCAREKVGNSGYWEPLEETVLVATDAPMNPGILPPTLA